MANQEVSYVLKVKDDGTANIEKVGSSVQKFDKRIDKSERQISSWRTQLSKAGSTVTRLGSAMTSFKAVLTGLGLTLVLKNLLDATNRQDEAIAGMETALKSMGRYTPELSQYLQDLASSMQMVTNFGDEATLEGTKLLLTYKQIGDEMLPQTVQAMLDLAVQTGSVTGAANMLGKAAMGMTGELRRAGITVDDNAYKTGGYAEVLKQIQEQVKGQAAAQREATGSMVALGNETGDVKEKLGALLKLGLEPLFKRLAEQTSTLNAAFSNLLADEDFKNQIEVLGESFRDQVISAGKTAFNVINQMGDTLFGLIDMIKSNTEIAEYGLIGYFLLGKKGMLLGAVTALIDKVSQQQLGKLTGTLEKQTGVWGTILQKFNENFSILGPLGIMANLAKKELPGLVQSLSGAGDEVEDANKESAEKTQNTWAQVFDRIKSEWKQALVEPAKELGDVPIGPSSVGAPGLTDEDKKVAQDAANEIASLYDQIIAEENYYRQLMVESDEVVTTSKKEAYNTMGIFASEYHLLKMTELDELAQKWREIGIAEVDIERWKAGEIKAYDQEKNEYLISNSDNLREVIRAKLELMVEDTRTSMERMADAIDNVFGTMQSTMSDVFYDAWTGELKSAEEYMQSFASSVLRAWADMIAEMIARWLMMKAITALGGGGTTSILHSGGIVGETAVPKRQVVSPIFAVAKKYHDGGVASNEVPAILKKGEGVFTPEQMKALGNQQVSITNFIDPRMMGQYMQTQEGANSIVNVIGQNSRKVVSSLRGGR